MTNLKEVAKRAGVSPSTVSRVINNHPYVNEEKRKSVLPIQKLVTMLKVKEKNNLRIAYIVV